MPPFVTGAILGFSVAAPVGPIGLLVIRRSLHLGPRAGFVSGLGAAAADLCYGILAAFGITLLARWQQPAALTGGIFLLYLAWTTWRSAAASHAAPAAGFAATFALTISNPITILSFAAMAAATGAGSPPWFVTGVFLGSAAWWAILSSAAGLFRQRTHPGHLAWINRASAVVLFVFACAALSRVARAALA